MGILHVDLEKMLQNPNYVNSIEAKAGDEFTSLHLAAIRGDHHAARLLVRAGANVEAPDHAKAKLLLHYGADIAVIWNGCERNVLHLPAHYGDVDMMKLFIRRAFQVVICTSLKDCRGKTPLDMLNDRDPSSQIREAFERLLDSVERQNRVNMSMAEHVDGSGSDGEMEFFLMLRMV